MTASLAIGTVVEGHRITGALGSGHMGDVYEAVAGDGSVVAIKVLRGSGAWDAQLLARFEREAVLCELFDNPHIVRVRGHGVHEGRPYLVMRRLVGHDLETWLEKTGPLSEEVAVEIVLQACEGISVAHRRGAIHRDIKPANIFLDEAPDGRICTVVCDFGIAKMVDEDGTLTASGAVLGTPLYMAPEQLVDSKRVDGSCDVWALAMTLYHALAGRAALADAASIADLVVALSTRDVPPIQEVAAWVSPNIARVIHAALLPRDRRIPSVDELAAALRRWGPAPTTLTREAMTPLPIEARSRRSMRAALPQTHHDVGSPDDATEDASSAAERASAKSAAEPPDALLGATLGTKYRLQRRLGVGGMGAVYEATDERGTRVAVKVMLGDAKEKSSESTRRFMREMRAVTAIDSPHVVRPVDFGVDEVLQMPFFVMELLEGTDLASRLASSGPLDPKVATELFVQACEALGAAAARDIVHRDIKPSNLFLHETADGDVVLKVCDFGIAKRLDKDVTDASTELTRTGGLLGSPLYMSPEHARNAKNVDTRSDIWSLGLSLHEALTGRKPWPGRTSVGEVILAICTEDIPSLAAEAPWVDARLAKAVRRTLVRNPAERLQTFEELARNLEPFRLKRPVRLSDLAPLPAAQRARAAIAVSGFVGGTTGGLAFGEDKKPERPRSRRIAIGVAALVAIAGAVTGVRLLQSSGPSGVPGRAGIESESAATEKEAAAAVVSAPSSSPRTDPTTSSSAAVPDAGGRGSAAAMGGRAGSGAAASRPNTATALPASAATTSSPSSAMPTIRTGQDGVGRGGSATELPP